MSRVDDPRIRLPGPLVRRRVSHPYPFFGAVKVTFDDPHRVAHSLHANNPSAASESHLTLYNSLWHTHIRPEVLQVSAAYPRDMSGLAAQG